MPGVRRRLLDILTALSLLLCLAVCVLWRHSYERNEWLSHRAVIWGGTHARDVAFNSGLGSFAVVVRHFPITHHPGPSTSGDGVGWHRFIDRPFNAALAEGPWTPQRIVWARRGFYFRWDPINGVYGNGWSTRKIVVPCWLVALLLSIPPAAQAWRFIVARRRRNTGLCPRCGYDLRATPDRCPECGTTAIAGTTA
jgi:hypothetical protein